MTAKLDGGCRYGFRITGDCFEPRRLVDAAVAFSAYASCDERADVESEAYLSAFRFGDDFKQRADQWGRLAVKGFDGDCWSCWLWFDIDREDDLDRALNDARKLVAFVAERYSLDDDALLIFFSGSKGFHVGLPTTLWNAEPSEGFHRVARKLAEGIAERIRVGIDKGVYDSVRAFRAPNSRHPKTGLHKRGLTFDELMGLSVDAVKRLAEKPEAFDVPMLPPVNEQAVSDWLDAARRVTDSIEAKAERRAAGSGDPRRAASRLNRATLDVIRNVEPIAAGDRHRLLFSAAANLAEFSCSPELAFALLSEAGLDAGLSPSEVRRQVECGLKHNRGYLERLGSPMCERM